MVRKKGFFPPHNSFGKKIKTHPRVETREKKRSFKKTESTTKPRPPESAAKSQLTIKHETVEILRHKKNLRSF